MWFSRQMLRMPCTKDVTKFKKKLQKTVANNQKETTEIFACVNDRKLRCGFSGCVSGWTGHVNGRMLRCSHSGTCRWQDVEVQLFQSCIDDGKTTPQHAIIDTSSPSTWPEQSHQLSGIDTSSLTTLQLTDLKAQPTNQPTDNQFTYQWLH